jgi:hypothetical protein
MTTPRLMPNGRRRPSPIEVESTIGSRGQIHGASRVTSPAKKANMSNKIMLVVQRVVLSEGEQ